MPPHHHSSASAQHSPSRLPGAHWDGRLLTCRRWGADAIPHWRLCRSCWNDTFCPPSSLPVDRHQDHYPQAPARRLRPVGGTLSAYVAELSERRQSGAALDRHEHSEDLRGAGASRSR